MSQKRPKYKYYFDYAGGSLVAKSLKELCEKCKTKFRYLEDAQTPPNDNYQTTDLFDVSLIVSYEIMFDYKYLTNLFRRGFTGRDANMVSASACGYLGCAQEGFNFQQYECSVGRFRIN